MTVSTTRTIWCDTHDCPMWVYVNEQDSVQEYRAKLRKQGWSSTPAGIDSERKRKDYCPECTKEFADG